MSSLLPQSFYERECLEVATDLVGKLLRHGPVTLRITEVEAYRFPGDTANHSRFGPTLRNAPMWGPAGHAYVYLCYGIHQMLNLVTDSEGRGAAVLIRSCEPVAGLTHVRARRGEREGPVLLNGPGKVGSALAVDISFSGAALFVGGGLEVLDAPPARELLVGPRVGIDYAEPRHRAAPWRIALAGTPWVSQRASLRPLDRALDKYLAAERVLDVQARGFSAHGPRAAARDPSVRVPRQAVPASSARAPKPDTDPRAEPAAAIKRRKTRS